MMEEKKEGLHAVVCDLDGVVTDTAVIHAKAWKIVFDEMLEKVSKEKGETCEPFSEKDYRAYVDGRPRLDGIRSFLSARKITLPEGELGDDVEKLETIMAIGNKKNKIFREILDKEGPTVFTEAVDFIKKMKSMGVRVAVASSSKNCGPILEAAGLGDLFEVMIDGIVSQERGLNRKPEPDIFIEAVKELKTTPERSAILEDATVGVEAGRNGGFALVVGVARKDDKEELFASGADVCVSQVDQLSKEWIEKWMQNVTPAPLFDAWDNTGVVLKRLDGATEEMIAINPHLKKTPKEIFSEKEKIVFFLDYDGTLTPIVDRPEMAKLSEKMYRTLLEIKENYTIAIVSGRMRSDVESLVNIQDIVYAGSHGFDIHGPQLSLIEPHAEKTIPEVEKVIAQMVEKVGDIEGVIIERKKFSVGVHYRLVKDQEDVKKIKRVVDEAVEGSENLRLLSGKMVFEILPAFAWNKGFAVRWVMNALNISWDDTTVVYVGDDTTDEDALRVVRTRGVGIRVTDQDGASSADFSLKSPYEAEQFLKKMLEQKNK
ncbi:MAG: trehalose-phosphatase [Candidatus Moranbacteria bacterium]|nr:trehalose-phosphatase [Candidatus Moranbacteria bacterium]